MEAVIVAGGFGSRLRPLTDHLPKHLLPVAGEPFVAHQIAKLADAGVRRVVLATSYYADRFEPVLGDGSAYGIELEYVMEDEPLGTGGAIRNAATALRGDDEPVLILNGDILSGHDLEAQLAHHRRRGADVTLHLVEVDDARPYGCVPTDQEDRVTAFLEKSADPVSRQVNAGCYLFDPEVVAAIPAGEVVSVERDTFPDLLADGWHVSGYLQQAYWLDVGTPAALCRASADIVTGVVSTPLYDTGPAESWVHRTAVVAPDADLRAGTTIGPRARVEAGVVAEASVLSEGVVVESGASLHHSVLGRGVHVGARAVLRDAALGDETEVSAAPSA
ncbi:MAG TPA: NDP-sugar synthase [Nocardioidaceae bacterium]